MRSVPAPCAVVGVIAFLTAVVATPREQWWAFVVDALVVIAVAVYVGLPTWQLVKRLRIELPFIAFAFLMPFVGRGPFTRPFGVRMSEPGLWSAWSIIAKGTLGVAATVVLASTTTVPQLIAALERLRVPRTLTATMGFMIRYADVVTDEMRRMRIARASRGDDARWLWQARAMATSAGALFVRSYERGERVYLAMESRGYRGTMPATTDAETSRWVACLLPAVAAAAVAAGAWLAR